VFEEAKLYLFFFNAATKSGEERYCYTSSLLLAALAILSNYLIVPQGVFESGRCRKHSLSFFLFSSSVFISIFSFSHFFSR